MKIANQTNNQYQVPISENSLMYMEPYERNHVEQIYKSTKEQLLCWGQEASYLDSEFCNLFERQDQGNY